MDTITKLQACPKDKGQLKCLVCDNDFDSGWHIPLVVPVCGHIFCKPCLEQSRVNSEKVTCPLCGMTTCVPLWEFAVNFEVIYFNDEVLGVRYCEVHKLQLVSQSLCRLCILLNKEYFSEFLESAQTLDYFKSQKSLINTQKLKYSKAYKEFLGYLKQIEKVSEAHVKNLRSAEEKLIFFIRSTKETCIEQVYSNCREVSQLKQNFQQQLRQIDQEILRVKQLKSQFEHSDISEQLVFEV